MNNTVQETPSAALLGTVATIAAQHGVIGNTSSTPIPPAQSGTSASVTATATATSSGTPLSSAKPIIMANENNRLSKRDTTETNHDRKSIAAGAPTLTKAETVFCGSTAGVVSRFVIAPLDVVKIRLQVQTQRKDLASILRIKSGQDTVYDAMTRTSQQPRYRGMFSGMATIAREEGIRGLWKGNMAAEYLYLTYGGIQFLVYQQTKAFLSAAAGNSRKRYPNNTTRSSFVSTIISSSSAQSFVSGATAGILATACTYPFDLLRTRFAVQREVKVYTGVLQAFRHIYLKDGVKGYYKGMSPALIQVIPYMGIMFGSYDTLKQLASWLKTKAANDDASISTSSPDQKSLSRVLLGLEDMLCGAMSGVISKTGVYPLDMVRKRLQIQGSDQQKANVSLLGPPPAVAGSLPGSGSGSGVVRAASTSMEAMPTTVWKTMVHIVRLEGYLALYKGLLPGVLKAAPASAVTFLVFSQTGALLERVRKSTQV
ncbi:mitochondrial thiamine pyrophosphate transporter [Podila minutissima]|uniref:Mitochondrial thiamine pyrophosphate transporter n=1 Tax=Podila minutissima TaxID=64525 RepID=A0A9P5STN6_9FUNG|nr:mitochondrial thiamine pyrophosphate transporter [Podila minutissima]